MCAGTNLLTTHFDGAVQGASPCRGRPRAAACCCSLRCAAHPVTRAPYGLHSWPIAPPAGFLRQQMTHISTAEDHMIEQQVLSDDTAVFTDPTGWVSATIRATGNGLGTVSIDWDDGEHIAD